MRRSGSAAGSALPGKAYVNADHRGHSISPDRVGRHVVEYASVNIHNVIFDDRGKQTRNRGGGPKPFLQPAGSMDDGTAPRLIGRDAEQRHRRIFDGSIAKAAA